MSFNWSSANFPNPTVDFGNKTSRTVIRSQMESGRVRQRRRFTTQWRTVSVKWRLSDDQWALFQGIVVHKLNDGADFFNIELPLGDGMQTYLARFVADSIQERYEPVMYWEVQAQLELEGESPLTESEVDALLTP